MQGLIPEGVPIYGEIEKMAEAFSKWLGDDPVRSSGGYAPKAEKPTWADPCPVCKGEMWDLRASKKNPKGPDARCKDTKWNQAENRFDGCSGLVWPPREAAAPSNDEENYG